MGQKVTRSDFEWVNTEEPHATRRKLILEKYPQIKKLFGYDPNLKWQVTFLVFIQLAMLFVMRDRSWPMILFAGYCFGGVINHMLLIAIHEITHNLAFGHSRPLWNKWFAIFANLPIGFPAAISFRRYHLDHHKYQGDARFDADIPTVLEAKLFDTSFGKTIWLFLLCAFYSLRPVVCHFKRPILLEYVNLLVQVAFDAFVFYVFGVRALAYLIVGTFLGFGIHPMAGHAVSEHYMFEKGFETYSYYGPMNMLTFNVGYHNEHHDFPYIPGCRLPEVKKIAPEFYDNIPQHTSWVMVLYNFVKDPNVGLYSRIRRDCGLKCKDGEAKRTD